MIISGVIPNGLRRTGQESRHDGRGGKTEPRAEENAGGAEQLATG